MGQGIDRVRLRARLLVGAAAIVLAAPVPQRAMAQEQPKWQPYVEAGGKVGTDRSLADVDLFIPIWQDQTSLLFGDLRGRFDNHGTNEGNFGLGYRTQVDPEWIVGGYGYFDIQGTDHDNTFYQVTLGLEALSVDWDFRANGYIPTNPHQSAPDEAKLQINGNTIQLRAGNETALYGFDGEVGWRLPFFPADGDVDVRAYIGGYYFNGQDARVVAGPRGRIEARLYDIDFLGLQSRLTASGEIQWDSPRGTQAFAGLELRIPLGFVTGETGPKLSPLDRRMVDRVQRDVDIVTQITHGAPEDVIVDELTVKTHTIFFANGTGGGSGTQGSPTDLAGAVSNAPAGSNAIIVAGGGAGVIGVANPLNLQPGQALLGGNSSVKLTGADSGQSVTFHVPGSRPTLSGGTTTANLIEMASGSQNRVSGVDLTGDFSNGIAGTDMERAIIIGNNIDGGDPGVGNGVYLKNLGGVPSAFVDVRNNTISHMSENGILIVNAFYGLPGTFSQSIRIADNTISDAGRNGIAMYTRVYHASLSQRFGIGGNSIAAVSSHGILLTLDNRNDSEVDSSQPTRVVQSGSVYANRVTGAGSDGIRVDDQLSRFAVDSTQALAITGNTIAGTGNDGIYVGVSFLNATATQSLAINGNRISGFQGDGIALVTRERPDAIPSGSSASLVQTFAIGANTIDGTGASGSGILVGNQIDNFRSDASLVVRQQGQISGNAISDTGLAGILFEDFVNGPRIDLSQSVLIAGNSVLMPGSFGILFDAEFIDVSHVSQAFGISANSIAGAVSDGISTYTGLIALDASSAALTQAFAIDGNRVSGVGGAGIVETTNFFDAEGQAVSLIQSGEINANAIAGAGSNGIQVWTHGDVSPSGSAALLQALAINNNVVSNVDQGSDLPVSGLGGIVVATQLLGDVTGSQAITLDPNTVSGVSQGGHGIAVYTSLVGGNLTQAIAIASNTVLGGLDGIRVATFVSYASFGQTALSQTLQIGANRVAGASRDGIAVYNNVSNSGSLSVRLDQSATIAGNQVSDSGETGIFVHNQVNALFGSTLSDGSANLAQTLDILGNRVSGSGGDGIRVGTYGSAGAIWSFDVSQVAAISQSVLIAGNTVVGSGFDGIFVGNDAATLDQIWEQGNHAGTVLLDQTLSIAANSVSGSLDGDGIHVGNYVRAFGGGSVAFSQAVVIDDNRVVSNAGDGILVRNQIFSDDSLGPVAFTQEVVIDPNTVIANSGDGIAVATYLSGHGVDGATQSISIAANRVSGAGRDGVYVGTFLTSVAASQTVVVQGNTVVGSGRDGIGVRTYLSHADLLQNLTIAGNSIGGTGRNGIKVWNAVYTGFEQNHLSQVGAITNNIVSDSGINGVFVSNRAFSLVVDDATIGQTLAITANTIDRVTSVYILTEQAIATTAAGSAAGGNGILVQNDISDGGHLTQALTVAQNRITNVLRDGVYVSSSVSGHATASQGFTISGNFVSASGRDGIHLDNELHGPDLSQSLAITGNSVLASFYEGIRVANAVFGFNHNLSQTGSIAGNLVSSSGVNGIELFNTAVAGVDNAHIGQTLAIVANTIDGVTSAYVNAGAGTTVGGNAILVQNRIGSFASLNQALTIAQNSITHVALFDGIYINTLASGPGATASQQFTVAGNRVTGSLNHGTIVPNGGYGVAIRVVGSDGGAATQSIAVVGNTLTNNFYGGVKLFASAGTGGTVTQVGSIAGNILTGAGANFGEGIDGVAVAGQGGAATQTISVSNNLIAGNAVGVYLKAGDRIASRAGVTLVGGTVSQTWSFTDNTISGNSSHVSSGKGGHGLYGLNSGANSTQTISLVSGNVIAGNQHDGVRLIDGAGTQSATLRSNLGPGPALNTITSNGTNLFASSAPGSLQSVSP
jgi:hypothetical protein